MAGVSGTALRPWLGQEGRVKKGARFGKGGDFPAIDHRRAKVLSDTGLFLPDAVKEPAGKASTRPSVAERPRSGGRTGAEKQSSSSPAAPASTDSTSIRSGDGHG